MGFDYGEEPEDEAYLKEYEEMLARLEKEPLPEE